MFCPKCGAPIKDGHKFCTACGFFVAGKQPAQKGAQTQAKGQAPANRPPQARPGKRPSDLQAAPKKRKPALGLLIGLVAGGLVLATAVAILLLLHPWSDEEPREAEEQPRQTVRREEDPTAVPKESAAPATEAAPAAEAPGPATEAAPATEAPRPVTLAQEYAITVWASYAAADQMRQQIDDFNRTNEYDLQFRAEIVEMGEADASDLMTVDVDSGADLFCFPSDQLARLLHAGALSPVPDDRVSALRTANDAGSVAAATLGDALYAYPMTADNGFFMYYDKSVIPEGDVDSLEKLIADCEAAGRIFAFEATTSAWYAASWFFATGCVSQWTVDEDGIFLSVMDTFNSPQGLVAARGMKKLLDSKCYLSASGAGEFARGAAIVVSGTWDYDTALSLLGDNLGVTDLPSFTVDGQTYHLGSYSGSKLLGVKPQTDRNRTQALHRLAEYLTGERCQAERFAHTSWGPSNRNAQQSPAVQANPALAALLKQNQYARPQGEIHGSWWDVGKALAKDIQGAKNDGDLQKALNAYYYSLCALFDLPQAEKDAWGVIGCICGTNWDTDFPMTETEPGVFRSERLTLHKGEEFKVRQGRSWDVNYGQNGRDGSNVVVDKDGNYCVWFDSATGRIWLEKK